MTSTTEGSENGSNGDGNFLEAANETAEQGEPGTMNNANVGTINRTRTVLNNMLEEIWVLHTKITWLEERSDDSGTSHGSSSTHESEKIWNGPVSCKEDLNSKENVKRIKR
jgi:hypothetical protein